MQKKQKIKAGMPVQMGAPWACLPRGATHHACGMVQTASLPLPHATTRPRPIGGTGFYAFFCSVVLYTYITTDRRELTEGKSARVGNKGE